MFTNSIYSFIRSMRMPFDNMGKVGRLFVSVLFLVAGISSLYVGITASYPIITVGAVLLCFISVILAIPGRKGR
ncbi:hypothetical protein [Polluticoccus soli]|uniref:hypothetical protein n=1 Tax=Polluticoccus soli TaxID=3034150 RepID=UPI0023E1C9F0|nr:hypothetical protein [Flavipsychrobacter sp. JY13-12]